MIIDRLVVCVARDCLGQPVFALGQKKGGLGHVFFEARWVGLGQKILIRFAMSIHGFLLLIGVAELRWFSEYG